MKQYRIYTEDVNRAQIASAASTLFKSYTVFEAEGVWDGVSEASVVVEIIASGIEAEKVYALANVIKAINKQQAVLVTVQDVESTLV